MTQTRIRIATTVLLLICAAMIADMAVSYAHDMACRSTLHPATCKLSLMAGDSINRAVAYGNGAEL